MLYWSPLVIVCHVLLWGSPLLTVFTADSLEPKENLFKEK